MRIADQPIIELGQFVGHQAEGDVQPFDVGVLGPTQQPDQVGALGPGQPAGLTGGHQILRVVQDDADALALLAVRLDDVALDDPVKEQEHVIRITRPGIGLAQPGAEILHHRLETLRVAAGQRAQTSAQVVLQHDVPRAEYLGCKEFREIDVRLAVPRRAAHQVADVSMEDEQTGGARKIQVGQLPCPIGIPGR